MNDEHEPAVDVLEHRGTDKLAAALAAAQAKYQPLKRTKTVKVKMKSGGTYSFKYAPLDACIDASRKALSDHGLAVTQVFLLDPLRIVTKLLHNSGQSIESVLPLHAGDSAQEFGGDMTYMRRYSYVAIVGQVADEDTDGPPPSGSESYEHGPTEPRQQSSPRGGKAATKKPPKGKPTKTELNTMYRKATGKATPEDKRWEKEQLQTEMLLRYQTEHSSDLTREQFTEMQEWIKAGPPKDSPPPTDSKTSPTAETQGGGPAGATTQPPPHESGPGTAAGEGGGSADGLAAYMDWGTKILKARSDGGDLEALRAQVRTAEGLTPALRAELYKRIDEGDTDGQEET